MVFPDHTHLLFKVTGLFQDKRFISEFRGVSISLFTTSIKFLISCSFHQALHYWLNKQMYALANKQKYPFALFNTFWMKFAEKIQE